MNKKTSKQNLSDSIKTFPNCPGVYIMKNSDTNILYIGKATNLKSRVSSYFSDKNQDRIQIPLLMNKVANIEFIATSNPTEALILEANLIRKHKPPYNIDLKDDKHYPYLKVTVNEQFPRLIVVRRVFKDGAEYFGPYTDVKTMRNIMAFAIKTFKIRDCKKSLPLKTYSRPCINHAINRCSGACAGLISQQDYRKTINLLLAFLRGRKKDVINQLNKHMFIASENLEYEKAGELRDRINLIKSFSNMQKVDLRMPDADTDIFGFYKDDKKVCLCILCFRHGILINKRHFFININRWLSSINNIDSVIIQYYEETKQIPPNEILAPNFMIPHVNILTEFVKSKFNRTTHFFTPQKGRKYQLLEMANYNAKLFMEQNYQNNPNKLLIELKKILKLPKIPSIIEAFDISNLGESFAVAGMVRFVNGIPNKQGYRKYKIKTVTGQNDFAMLIEAVFRRLSRLEKEKKSFPDMILIDGGKGQLSSACKVLRQFKNPPMIISLAKKEETLFSIYSDPVNLPPTSDVRKLVQRIRDEVHRFSITFHRKIRGKQFKGSSLENIHGLGALRSKQLLKIFGSVEEIKKLTVEELSEVKGISTKLASVIIKSLNK